MILTFYVHGRGKDEPEPLSWLKDSWDVVTIYAKQAGEYLGIIESTSEPIQEEKPVQKSVQAVQRTEERGWLGSLVGGFSGLRSGEVTKSAQRGLPPPGTYKMGEVHGDYVKVSGSS